MHSNGETDLQESSNPQKICLSSNTTYDGSSISILEDIHVLIYMDKIGINTKSHDKFLAFSIPSICKCKPEYLEKCKPMWYCWKGSSPDLMPSIMGAFDAYLGQKDNLDNTIKTSTPKRTHQVGNFANLSPCVQKILSHVPEQEITKKFSSEEILGPKRLGVNRPFYRSMREKSDTNKSSEKLDIISPSVHKMLSNLPDELVISASNYHISPQKNITRNSSYLHSSNGDLCKKRIYYSDQQNSSKDSARSSMSVEESDTSASDKTSCEEGYCAKPLGSYLHSSKGIANRTPVGRKNLGKYLQVPSEASAASAGTNSTVSSSEVSRPVSLTSLGSCSSSESSHGENHHHRALAYLASAESLDSEPEQAGSQGSADSGIAEQEPTPLSQEQRVLQEVLETERVYVKDLDDVIQGYLLPWRNDPECPLEEHLKELFSNIEEIHEFNSSFLDDLHKADCDPTRTANVFLQHNSGFSVYNEYCAHYPRTMEVLSKLQRDEKMTPLFREKQQALNHALPLGSYLLKPVQRILKYHLLLQRLSKQCEAPHKMAVDLALTTMTGIATEINNMKRKHEHAVRVQEIQSQLLDWNGPDLTTLGELIAEGAFRVQGARGRRHILLFEKVLILAKNKQDGGLGYKGHIMCSDLMLIEQVRGEPVLSFQVLSYDNPEIRCTLRAKSPAHKKEWTLQIKRVILENYSAVIPEHARQLVMQLGQNVNQTDQLPSERWSPLKPNSPTPHYLERRSKLRNTKDFSSGRRASSRDRSFSPLGSWRRKSEPSMVPQVYTFKRTVKLKKMKENGNSKGGSVFYTDVSDSETCDMATESLESVDNLSKNGEEQLETSKEQIPRGETIEDNLQKLVSDLLLQRQEFKKAFNRVPTTRHPRRNVNSEPGPIWYETERPQLPSKSDSLPRSARLNDHVDGSQDGLNFNVSNFDRSLSLKENPESYTEEPHENDLSSRLDESEHPEHKIYRKSTIRLSILQRIRMIMSEERSHKYYVKGSKSTGEKLAHPDYEDPHKLMGSRNSSSLTLYVESNSNGSSSAPSTPSNVTEQEDLMGEPVLLDMSLNEKEVLKEFEDRLKGSSHESGSDSTLESSSKSSQNSSSSDYYESILDSSLKEEYIRDKVTGKLVLKNDSFSSPDKPNFLADKPQVKEKRPIVRRPTRAPPPIPVKPQRLAKNNGTNTETINKDSSNSSTISCNQQVQQENHIDSAGVQTNWVKMMVGRFE